MQSLLVERRNTACEISISCGIPPRLPLLVAAPAMESLLAGERCNDRQGVSVQPCRSAIRGSHGMGEAPHVFHKRQYAVCGASCYHYLLHDTVSRSTFAVDTMFVLACLHRRAHTVVQQCGAIQAEIQVVDDRQHTRLHKGYC